MAPDETPQPPQQHRLMPGMHVQDGPKTIMVRRTPEGHVLFHIEHMTGATSIPMTHEFAKAVLAQLQEATGGIVVPPRINGG